MWMKVKQMILIDVKSIGMRNVVIFIDHKYYPISAMYLFNWSKTFKYLYYNNKEQDTNFTK